MCESGDWLPRRYRSQEFLDNLSSNHLKKMYPPIPISRDVSDYVFEMYRSHMGARQAPMRIRGDELTVLIQEGAARMAALVGSASIREKRLTVTMTNPSLDSPVTAHIRLAGGAQASEGRGVALTHSDMRARNTFQNSDEVRPASLPLKIGNERVVVVIPKHAVAAVEIQLA
jgi:alpha-N-arabinofuranosidase